MSVIGHNVLLLHNHHMSPTLMLIVNIVVCRIMNKGGRRTDPVWEYFEKVKEGNSWKAICKCCGHKQSTKACRMNKHYKMCAGSKNSTERVEADEPTELVSAATMSSTSSSVTQDIVTPDFSEPPTPKKKKTTQSSIFDHVYKTPSNTRDSLHIKVAKFFYGCNIPFNVADNKLFIDLVTSLRPGYTPPTARNLSGPLLNKVSGELDAELAQKLDGKTATLVEDDWSNIHNEPVTATSLHIENKSYFVEAVNTGAMTKSGENCKNMTQTTIKHMKEKYNCKVRAVVTDNAKNMETMRNQLHEEDPDLIVYGCSSHWLNFTVSPIIHANFDS